MGIGKAIIAMLLLSILAFGMVAAFSIVTHDKSTDQFYNDSVNYTANQTVQLSGIINASSTNLVIPLVLVSAILLFGAFILFFRKVR